MALRNVMGSCSCELSKVLRCSCVLLRSCDTNLAGYRHYASEADAKAADKPKPKLSFQEQMMKKSKESDGPSISIEGLNREQIRQFSLKITQDERKMLLEELQDIQAAEIKKEYKGKLARLKWRTKLGRPAALKADPTGTFCEVPPDWLQKKLAEKLPPPTTRQLMQLAIFNSMPFIGFGFLDNLIMILVGEYIDTKIGVAFGISTMAAAGIGNTLSDVAGIGSAFYVELMADKIGIKLPDLQPAQLERTSARWAANLGRGGGVVLGCLLGMFPLLFFGSRKEEKKDEDETKEKKDEDETKEESKEGSEENLVIVSNESVT